MATNPKKIVSLSSAQLETLAGGGSITSGDDTYTADENTLYLTPDVIDNAPTQNSTNPVTSGGVYTALASKQDALSSSNKLSADYISDGTTNKVFTATEQTKLSGVPTTSTAGQLLKSTSTSGTLQFGNGLPYITTEPSAANANGLIIVVLSSEPATRYSGYLYIIT